MSNKFQFGFWLSILGMAFFPFVMLSPAISLDAGAYLILLGFAAMGTGVGIMLKN